ncbi:hypothetical protein F444_05597 [Phytophthora nicotianae P1976]|uniref:ZSWIM1/3 RNaseH-like domain-containing protein n=1 Tax=Phytophthora nicotianae P1976 TaxID=1317066 RepID=A0A081ALM2_PHYNI|nr:hypothetical protein F444_05597 [Phytophthora nicotianae P1976]
MVTDMIGTGSFAQHALIDGETKLNMKSAVKAFKQNNPACLDIKMVVVDKDFSEIEVLAEALPEARREISKVYGSTTFEKTHAKNLVTLMARTTDEREFDRYLQALQTLSKDKPQFYEYLESNWLSCKDYIHAWEHTSLEQQYEQPIRG